MASTRHFWLRVLLLVFAHLVPAGNTLFNSTTEPLVASTEILAWNETNTTNGPTAWIMLRFDIQGYVITILAALGLCGNMLALLVWGAEPVFQPATFFMKALAVSDSCFVLSSFCLWQTFSPTLQFHNMTSTAFVASRAVSANTTMALVFTRWLAVHHPLKVKILLTRKNVVVSYGLILIWCSLVLTAWVLQLWRVTAADTIKTTFLIADCLCAGLPIVVMVFLNVSLVSKMRGHRHTSSHGARRFQGLLVAVVCLSVTTILAFPLGFIIRALRNSVGSAVYTQHCGAFCMHVLQAFSGVLEVLNASINVVYYLLFASQFRQLLSKRFSCSQATQD